MDIKKIKKFIFSRKGILIAILVLATILRIWSLNSVPSSTSMDEASISYNAYSVMKIGVDEFGDFPFLSQRGYDDWRRSTYLFLAIPFIALFDLNSFAVRLPAVILSVLSIFAVYHIVLNLFLKRSSFAISAALVTSLMMAISPWHIYISRLGHESNAGLAFLIFGVLFFLSAIKKKNLVKILLSMTFFTLSMVSYYSGQAFIPPFILGLLFIYRKTIFSKTFLDKRTLIILFTFAIMIAPILWNIFSPTALIRFQGTSTFKPEAHSQKFAKRVELRNEAVEQNNLVGTIFYNRRFFPVQVFIEGYITHFKPKWLFTNSGSESFKVPNIGLLYLWEIPLILLGMLVVVKSTKLFSESKKLIFVWFFLAPLPAAIATQTPHAMRSYNFFPIWQIFTALGIAYVLYRLGRYKKFGSITLLVIVILSLQLFYKNYFTNFPNEQSDSFHYALSRTIPYVVENQSKYEKIVFSNEDNLYQSYMLFLYYTRYDPLLYQSQGGTVSGGYAETHKFGKYEFRPINWEDEKVDGVLFIVNPNNLPDQSNILFQGKYLDESIGAIVLSKDRTLK